MLGCISISINKCKAHNIPIVIGADSYWHLTNNPDMSRGYNKAMLNPNALELELSMTFSLGLLVKCRFWLASKAMGML